MGVDAGDRLRGGVLIGAALAVLAAGGWWWWDAAPVVDPTAAPTPPSALADLPVPGPLATVQVEIAPGTGRIIGLTQVPDHGDPDVGLPTFTDTLWRERLVLVPGQPPVSRDSLPDGARHLFQYRCSGNGQLLVTIIHDEQYTENRQTACDGDLGSLELPDPLVRTRLYLSAVEPGPVELEAQLVALP
ncbi:hypothetical protein V6U81_02980 [Micromonospora sp. CPCC 205711]|uniref:hypothetical protein n=1 Tax=Micromonospora sp. CPCC 205547 TaxID=3122400 RepID=UPI002FF3A91F